MRELGRVFANEWIKLMNRRRLWITILLGVLVVCGLTVISYVDYQRSLEYHSLEGREHRLEQMQQRLSDIKEQPAGENSERSEGYDREQETRMLEGNIAALKKDIEQSRKITSGDWQSVLKERKAQIENDIENLSDKGNQQQANRLKGDLMKLNYRLDNDVRPQVYWEKSAHNEMTDMLGFTSIIFLPMLVVILVADMVSGETTSGTIKLLLVRPVSRVKILFGKWLVSITAAGILTVVFCFVMWGANLALYGTEGANQPVLTGVDYTYEMQESSQPGIPARTVGIPHYDGASIIPQWQYILTGVILIAFSMAAVATITLLCSTLFKSAMVSTGVAFGLIIIAQIFVEMISSGKWLFWLFSVHLNLLNNWTGQLSSQLGMNLPLWSGILVLTVWSVLSLVAALIYFKRKDVLNA